MPELAPRLDIEITAFPTLTAAARMMKVSAATLSRGKPPFEGSGRKEHHLRPRVVLEEASFYGRRPIREVAADLIGYAKDHGSAAAVEAVRREVREVIDRYEHPERIPVQRLLDDARRVLPGTVYAQVESIVAHAGERPKLSDVGGAPTVEDPQTQVAVDNAPRRAALRGGTPKLPSLAAAAGEGAPRARALKRTAAG